LKDELLKFAPPRRQTNQSCDIAAFSESGASRPPQASSTAATQAVAYTVGEDVKMKDFRANPWQHGRISSILPLQVNGRAFKYVEKVHEWPVCAEKTSEIRRLSDENMTLKKELSGMMKHSLERHAASKKARAEAWKVINRSRCASDAVADGERNDHAPSTGAAEKTDECAICLGGYDDDTGKIFLPCCHSFHEVCATDWINAKKTCPTCRHPTDYHHAEVLAQTPVVTG